MGIAPRQSQVAAAESRSYHAARHPARTRNRDIFQHPTASTKRQIAMLIAMKSKVAKWVLS
jgi:hypothetical protein